LPSTDGASRARGAGTGRHHARLGDIAVILWIGGHGRHGRADLRRRSLGFVFNAVLVPQASVPVGGVGRPAPPRGRRGAYRRAARSVCRRSRRRRRRSPCRTPARGLPSHSRGGRFRSPRSRASADGRVLALQWRQARRSRCRRLGVPARPRLFSCCCAIQSARAVPSTVDGVTICGARPAALRARIGLVPQDPVIFGGEAWENIGYGRPAPAKPNPRRRRGVRIAGGVSSTAAAGLLHISARREGCGSREAEQEHRPLARHPAQPGDHAARRGDGARSTPNRDFLVQQALGRLSEVARRSFIAHRLRTCSRLPYCRCSMEAASRRPGDSRRAVRQGGLYARLAALAVRRVT